MEIFNFVCKNIEKIDSVTIGINNNNETDILVVYKNDLTSFYSISRNILINKYDYKCVGLHYFEPLKNMDSQWFYDELSDCELYTYEDFYNED